MATQHHRACPLCEATCGLRLDVEGDTVTAVRGDPDNSFSNGFICPKGAALGALHHDPDRLRSPMVRRDGKLVPATWEEAFAAVEAGLGPIFKAGDRNAVALYLGNPNVHNLDAALYIKPLIKALATQNLYTASTIDQMPRHVSCGLLFGSPDSIPVPDIDRTDFILMLGANPWASNGSLMTAPDMPGRLRALKKRGGTLVVVDPRRSQTARRASLHLPIRPGTDAFLLMALLHTLFEEGQADPAQLAPIVDNIDAVRDLVQPFSPDAVAEACGLDAVDIRQLALDLAAAPSAAVYGRMGAHTVAFGTLGSWACDALNILTGNLDTPGGVMFPRPAHLLERTTPGGRGFARGRWTSRVSSHPEVRGELPCAALVEEIETPGPGQIRALITVAGNPVISNPDSRRLDAALATLDFMVCVDFYLNETTRHADVILPPPSPLERPHFDAVFNTLAVRNVAHYAPALFAAPGPPESEILSRLAMLAAGQGIDADVAFLDGMILSTIARRAIKQPGSPIEGRSLPEILGALDAPTATERALDLMLRSGPYGDAFGANPDGLTLETLKAKPHGMDFGALTPRLPNHLNTPDARINLAPDAIAADFPRLVDALESSSDGLLLVGRRHLRSNNSWMHNLEPLAGGRALCTLQVHPDDAARLGLEDGATATVRSRVGAVSATVEITEHIRPGVVSLPHGWGHDAPDTRLQVAARRPGVNSNILTDPAVIDPLSGNTALNAIPVEVAPVDA